MFSKLVVYLIDISDKYWLFFGLKLHKNDIEYDGKKVIKKNWFLKKKKKKIKNI